MKVSIQGIKNDIPAKLQEKLDAKFAKLSKLVDGRGEKQAHVVVTSERHLHKAEVTFTSTTTSWWASVPTATCSRRCRAALGQDRKASGEARRASGATPHGGRRR